MATDGHQRQRGIVVAAVERKIIGQAIEQVEGSGHVAGCILQTDDARDLREPHGCVIGQIGDRATWNVVQDDRQPAGLGDFAEVAVQTFLTRLVVIGDDLQRGGCTHLCGVAGEVDCLAGGVATGSGDHGDSTGCLFNRHTDQACMLIDIDRGRLAGGADSNDRCRAALDVPVDEAAVAGQIEAAILMHRRDDGDNAACDHVHMPDQKL